MRTRPLRLLSPVEVTAAENNLLLLRNEFPSFCCDVTRSTLGWCVDERPVHRRCPSLGKPAALGGRDVFDVRGRFVMSPSVFTSVNVASNIDETQRMMGGEVSLWESQLMH